MRGKMLTKWLKALNTMSSFRKLTDFQLILLSCSVFQLRLKVRPMECDWMGNEAILKRFLPYRNPINTCSIARALLAGHYNISFRVALHSLLWHTSINFHVGCQFGVHLVLLLTTREKEIASVQINSIRFKCEKIDWTDFLFETKKKKKPTNNQIEDWIVFLEMMSVRLLKNIKWPGSCTVKQWRIRQKSIWNRQTPSKYNIEQIMNREEKRNCLLNCI